MDRALDAAGRERHTLSRYLNIDAAPRFSLSSVAAFEDAVGRAAELGFRRHHRLGDEPFRGVPETLDAVVSDVLPRWR